MKKFVLIITAFFLCFSLFAASSNKALDEWNKLSEDEKWLCLLTEPFLYAKGVSMISVNPEPENAGEKSRNILERDWKLHSKKDIIAIVERYKNGQWGDEPVFQDVKKLYNVPIHGVTEYLGELKEGKYAVLATEQTIKTGYFQKLLK